MKTLALALLTLLPPAAFAAPIKQNPANFPLKVHVISSAARQQWAYGLLSPYQVLEAVIDKQPVELRGISRGVLAPQDYPARLSRRVHAPNSKPNTYDIYRGYDLLMPDGTSRTYTVTRLGPACTNP